VPWQQHPPHRQVQGLDLLGSGESSWDAESSSSSACSDEGDAGDEVCSAVSTPESRLPSSTFRTFSGGRDSSPNCGPEGLGTPDSEPG
jgi:hypothetical protein